SRAARRGARHRRRTAPLPEDASASEGAPAGVTARRRASVRPAAPTPARGLLDPRELQKLTVLMEESGLIELEIESGGEKVRLVRGRVGEPAAVAASAPSASTARAARREPDIDSLT